MSLVVTSTVRNIMSRRAKGLFSIFSSLLLRSRGMKRPPTFVSSMAHPISTLLLLIQSRTSIMVLRESVPYTHIFLCHQALM